MNGYIAKKARPGGHEGRREKTMLIDTLKNELERAYRVLSADNADMLNSRDIWVWE